MLELITEKEEAQRKLGWRVAVWLDNNGKDWRAHWEKIDYSTSKWIRKGPISTYMYVYEKQEKTWRNHRAAKRAAKKSVKRMTNEKKKESIKMETIYVY